MFGSNCLWCNKEVTESDESHVLPECFGNDGAQIIPEGVICKKCNNYFGSKIEPSLIDDPMLHAIAVATRVIDPGDGNAFRDLLFDHEHPATAPVVREINLDLKIANNTIELDVDYRITGKIKKEYNRRSVAKVSRAIHKISFESFVLQHLQNEGRAGEENPFYPKFDHLKKWTREGQPRHKVRPFVRMPAKQVDTGWDVAFYQFGNDLAGQLRFFGDWFAVSLTSPPEQVEENLRDWYSYLNGKAILVSDSYGPL